MAKGGLGKGLDALLPQAEREAETSKKISEPSVKAKKEGKDGAEVFIDVDLLQPNPHQPRREFDEEALQNLADSIKENGVIQPILAESAPDGTFWIIAGERRTRAARLAGLKQVPVRIQKFSETKKLEVALVENIQREDLNPLEEAKAYHKLMELGNLSQEETARRVGKNRSTVANALRLLKLPDDMQKALGTEAFSAGHARAVLSVADPSLRRTLFTRITDEKLSVREAEEIAAEMNSGKKLPVKTKVKSADKREPDYVFLEQRLIEKLGTKVSLRGNFDKGVITLEYFSREDLDRFYNLLTGADK